MKKIGIISCNTNNLFSISNAFQKLNCKTIISNEKNELLNCDILVLPGVGAFNVAMDNIKNKNIDDIIFEFVKTGKTFLGICLGFQLLFETSEEFVKSKGLGLLKGNVLSFDKNNMIVPHVGWNTVETQNKNLIGPNIDNFYFVHSFYAKPYNSKNILCLTDYSNFKFCSGVEKDNIFGVQFHPEKSHRNGMQLLKNFSEI